MSIKNYRFVSPGVFVNEIDNSQIPASPAGIGPVIIGRAEKGPALRPTTVDSFEEFVSVFGAPAPGSAGGDIWRQGNNTTATTYGAYAAQAYLRNSSPLTYIRLLGSEAQGFTPTEGEAGWTQTNAWGLIVFEPVVVGSAGGSARHGDRFEGALGAVFYAPSYLEPLLCPEVRRRLPLLPISPQCPRPYQCRARASLLETQARASSSVWLPPGQDPPQRG